MGGVGGLVRPLVLTLFEIYDFASKFCMRSEP